MTGWHRSWRADLSLRVLGMICCGLAYAAISHLCALRPFGRAPAPIPYALAAIGFVCASAGATLVAVGRYLFDDVQVSARWGGSARQR